MTWALTEEAFAKLMNRLDADLERAGARYAGIRRQLLRFFEWRGASFPEERADETLNRVARKLDEGAEIAEIGSYCQGIARLVLLESYTSQLVIPAGIERARLQLKIKENRYPSYRISAQAAEGRTIRTLQNLHPGRENIFTIWLPSRLFASGEYVLALSGVDENGESDSLSKTLFRVESKARTARN